MNTPTPHTEPTREPRRRVDPALGRAVEAFWKSKPDTDLAFGFALKLCKSKEHAWELFSAAVTSVISGSPPWNGTSKIAVLVCGVIRRIYIDERRSAGFRYRTQGEAADEVPVSSASPERMALKIELHAKLAAIAETVRAELAGDALATKVFASIMDDDLGEETLSDQAKRLGIPDRDKAKLENARRRVAYTIQKHASEELAP